VEPVTTGESGSGPGAGGSEAEKIATLREVAQIASDDEARRRLVYADWNLETAIEMFLAGRDIPANPIPSSGAAPAGRAPAASTRDGRAAGSRAQGWRMVLRIIFFPFRAAMSLVSFISNSIVSWLGLGTLAIEGETPVQATERFINAFEQKYSTAHPTFCRGSYADALRQAEREFKFLLVYLHSDRHFRSPQFCREVLTDPALIRYVDEAFVFWAGSVSSQEAASAQHALGMTTFPFVAVVTTSRGRPHGRRISVKEGQMNAGSLVSHLQGVLERHGMSLVAARLEQEEMVNSRRLREEQDREYERSLEADRAREREAAEAASAAAAAEEEAKAIAAREAAAREQLAARRREKEAALAAHGEPDKTCTEPAASIVIRLPDGTRASRRFWGSDKMSRLFDWADVQGVDITVARLVSTFPRRAFAYPEDADATVADSGLAPSAMLVIEERLDLE